MKRRHAQPDRRPQCSPQRPGDRGAGDGGVCRTAESEEATMTTIAAAGAKRGRRAGVGRIALASLVGTTIEFYDFYIFGTAAALVFGPMFFPKSAPETQILNAYLTFGLAFLARPVGSFLFGHFGDRRTQIDARRHHVDHGARDDADRRAALLCERGRVRAAGARGSALPARRWARRRMGRAALIAVENAPHGKRAWYGMFPQLGPPIGFIIATGLSSAARRIWRGRLCRLGLAGPVPC